MASSKTVTTPDGNMVTRLPKATRMDLVIGTLALRPYVFAFLALFLVAGFLDVGWRRTLVFGLAVRGDRWFLGRIFYYPDGGVYFGVPLSNFAGWTLVGATGVGLYLAIAGGASAGRVWPGVALYYVVLGFNLAVTAWIGEWGLLALGGLLHAIIAVTIRLTRQTQEKTLGSERPGVQRA